MKKIILTIILSAGIIYESSSQQNLFGASWEFNAPINQDYIDETSFSGFKLEYRYRFDEKFSAGLAVNWCTYDQYFSRQTFQKPDGSGAITSDFIAQVYQVPITATAHYYFSKSKMIEPYAGIALGAQYLDQSIYYNVYVSEDDTWGFVARPEVGAILYPGNSKFFGILVGASYSFSTNTTEFVDKNNFSNFGINVGVIFGN